MATFTVSVSASLIDVTAGTGTLAQLYADVEAIDATAMTISGADPYTYEIEGNRELQIGTGVTLNMQNDSDVLQWDLSAAKYPVLDIQEGATFNVGDGTTGGDDQQIIGDINNASYCYIYVYGSFNCQGTVGHEVIIKNYRSMYFYSRTGSLIDWDYVKLQECTYAYGYHMSFAAMDTTGDIVANFNYVTIEETGVTENGYGILGTGGFFGNTVFNNMVIDNTLLLSIRSCTMKWANCTIQNIASSYPRMIDCGKQSAGYFQTSKTEPYSVEIGQKQGYFVMDTCTFDNNYDDTGNNYAFFEVGAGSIVLFKDCTFQNAYYGCRVNNGGVAIHYNSTFTSITVDKVWAANGTHLHARKLTLTVNDSGGSPLQDAIVNVRQKEGYENWTFITDASGQIKDIWGDDPVFIEKEETSTGVYDQWSDGTGNQIHEIIISHPDYETAKREVAFTENQTLIVQLADNPAGVTKIYDSTIYDSTIY